MFGNLGGWVRRAVQEACRKVDGRGLEVVVVGKRGSSSL